jgi:hypothetical protein
MTLTETLARWSRRRGWPLLFALITVATGMAFSFVWAPVVRHHTGWVVPGDIWGTFRSAHYVAWGDIGDVYAQGTGLVTLPGISVLLAPVAFVTYHLGLSEPYPIAIPHPTAWLFLGPAMLLLGTLALFATDALAEWLGVGHRQRVVLVVVEAVFLWPVIAVWGHPEDPVALGLAVYGLLSALKGRWRSCGWLWGAALVVQPLVVLVLPIIFALAPVRRWLKLGAQVVAPTVALVAIPLVTEWSQTTLALFKQPNYPTIDHPTPWLAFAPVLQKAHPMSVKHFARVGSGSQAHFTVWTLHTVAAEAVAAGPGRVVAIILALGLGVWVYRRRPSPMEIVWVAAVALSLRCFFEAVMDPYYLWPPLAIAFVLLAQRPRRLPFAVTLAGFITYWSYRHVGPWEWWLPIVAALGAIVWVARPATVGVTDAAAVPSTAVAIEAPGEQKISVVGVSR